jgi:hypothetical protein
VKVLESRKRKQYFLHVLDVLAITTGAIVVVVLGFVCTRTLIIFGPDSFIVVLMLFFLFGFLLCTCLVFGVILV